MPFSEISEARGGFILYPSGERVDDPGSAAALPGNPPGQIGVNPGLAYDLSTRSWVPVPLNWLAPNGQVYAYEDFNVHIMRGVTVATGASRDVTRNGAWLLIGTSNTGIYASQLNTPGAWFVPFGAEPQQMIDHA